MLFSSYFCQKNTHKTHEIVKVAVINDNNNFAPSFFRSLCEFVGDCFGPRYFSSGAALPQKNTSVQNNHLRFHTMTSKKMLRSYYCLNKTTHSPPYLPIGLFQVKTTPPLGKIYHKYSTEGSSAVVGMFFPYQHVGIV